MRPEINATIGGVAFLAFFSCQPALFSRSTVVYGLALDQQDHCILYNEIINTYISFEFFLFLFLWDNSCHFRTSFCEGIDGFSMRRELQGIQTTTSCPHVYGWHQGSVCPPQLGPSYDPQILCISVQNKQKTKHQSFYDSFKVESEKSNFSKYLY